MQTVPALSEASKARLTKASEHLCDLLEAGESIEKAAAMSALDYGVPPAHLPLLCNAANVAAMESQRLANDTTMAKAAQVEVARPENVLKLMLSHNRPRETKKCAAEVDHRAWLPPSQLTWKPTPAPAYYQSPAPPRESGPSENERQRRKVAAMADQLAVEGHRAVAAFHKTAAQIVDALKRRVGPSFSDLCRDGPSVFGKEASAVLAWIEEQLPDRTRQEPARYAPVSSPVFNLLKSAVNHVSTMRDWAAAEEKMAELVERTNLLEQFEQSVDDRKLEAADVVFGVKKAVGMGDVVKLEGLKSLLDAGMRPRDPLKEAPDIRNDTEALEHEAALRNIRVASELGSLLGTDEVIRRFPPTEVIGHYNELAHTAPTALLDKATMRALLRQRLEAGKQVVNPYEIDLLRKIDKSYGPASNPVTENAVA